MDKKEVKELRDFAKNVLSYDLKEKFTQPSNPPSKKELELKWKYDKKSKLISIEKEKIKELVERKIDMPIKSLLSSAKKQEIRDNKKSSEK